MTRAVGFGLIILAIVVCLLGSAWLVSGLAEGRLETISGAVLGLALLVAFLAGPLLVVGVLVVRRGGKESRDQLEAEQLRKILDMTRTAGQISVSDLVIELKSDLPAVQNMIYKLVGMGVFDGYVNWKEGILYSQDASALRAMTECRNCGGKLSLAGKGVIKCPFCGTEYFLSG